MSFSVKVSELTVLKQVTSDDYIVINDSSSVTTKIATLDTVVDFLTGSNKPFKKSLHADQADFANFAIRSTWSDTASFSTRSISASYALSSSYSLKSEDAVSASYALSASYVPINVNLVDLSLRSLTSDFATHSLSASFASRSISASYAEKSDWSDRSGLSDSTNFLNYFGTPNGTASYAMRAESLVNPNNLSIAGDVTGVLGNTKVVKIQNRPVTSTTPKVGDVLYYDGTAWIPKNFAGGMATAWAYFNGIPSGTPSGANGNEGAIAGNCQLYSSYNVKEIYHRLVIGTTCNQVGLYKISFSTPMINTNYMIMATAQEGQIQMGGAIASEFWWNGSNTTRPVDGINWQNAVPYDRTINHCWIQVLNPDSGDKHIYSGRVISVIIFGGI